MRISLNMENQINENIKSESDLASVSEISAGTGNNGPDNSFNPVIAAPPTNDEPVNTVAKEVTPAEIIERRGRGRPKGSKKTKENSETGATQVSEITAGEIVNEPSEINNPPAGEPSLTESTSNNPEQAKVTDYNALAGLTVGMGTSTLAMIFGPEWQPEDENERTQLTIAVAQYMQSKEVKDIPPGALLAIVLMTYSAKRFRQPSTKNKIKMGWHWLRSKFGKKKMLQPVTTNSTGGN